MVVIGGVVLAVSMVGIGEGNYFSKYKHSGPQSFAFSCIFLHSLF